MAREFYPDDQIIYDVILEANTRRSGLEFLYSPAPGLLQAMDARRSLDFAMGEKPIEVALAPTLSINNVSFTQAIELAVSDRKSTRLNSSHSQISYAVVCLKKKKKKNIINRNI